MGVGVVSSLFSFFCPLGSVAAGVFAGDRAHLWLTAISGVYEAAAPEHHCRIITCRVVATFPVKRLNWEDWSSGLRMLCGGASLWRVLIFVFSSIGALSVFACCTPSKRGIFAFEWLSRICVWVLNITKRNTVCSFTWVLLLLYMCLRRIFTYLLCQLFRHC